MCSKYPDLTGRYVGAVVLRRNSRQTGLKMGTHLKTSTWMCSRLLGEVIHKRRCGKLSGTWPGNAQPVEVNRAGCPQNLFPKSEPKGFPLRTACVSLGSLRLSYCEQTGHGGTATMNHGATRQSGSVQAKGRVASLAFPPRVSKVAGCTQQFH